MPEAWRSYPTRVPCHCLLHLRVTSSAFAAAFLKRVQLWIHSFSGKILSVSYGQALPEVCQHLRPVVPNLCSPKGQACGRQFFHGLRVEGWFQDESSTSLLLCTLFLTYRRH